MEGDMQALRGGTVGELDCGNGTGSAVDPGTPVTMAADAGILFELRGTELVSERSRIELADPSTDTQTETDACCEVTNVIAAGSVVQ